MSELPDIFNTAIINEKWDQFWELPKEQIALLEQAKVLVLSKPFEQGSQEELQLHKMMQACKLQKDQFQIIQMNDEHHLAWHQIRDQLQTEAIILLGVSPEQLGVAVQFMPHQVTRFNGSSWIVTSSLQQLLQYPDIKTHLWNYGLKPVFVDKVYG